MQYIGSLRSPTALTATDYVVKSIFRSSKLLPVMFAVWRWDPVCAHLLGRNRSASAI